MKRNKNHLKRIVAIFVAVAMMATMLPAVVLATVGSVPSNADVVFRLSDAIANGGTTSFSHNGATLSATMGAGVSLNGSTLVVASDSYSGHFGAPMNTGVTVTFPAITLLNVASGNNHYRVSMSGRVTNPDGSTGQGHRLSLHFSAPGSSGFNDALMAGYTGFIPGGTGIATASFNGTYNLTSITPDGNWTPNPFTAITLFTVPMLYDNADFELDEFVIWRESLGTPVVFNGVTANGAAGATTTTTLTLDFDTAPTGLTTSNIALSIGGTTRTFSYDPATRVISNISGTWVQGATATVTLTSPTGLSISPLVRTATMHLRPTTNVNFTGVTANDTANPTTTQLTLNFSGDPGALTASNLNIPGVTIDSITGTGNSRTVNISGAWNDGASVNVSIASSPAYTNISGGPFPVTLYRAPTYVAFTGVTANGTANSTTTTQLRLNFSGGFPTSLTEADITLNINGINCIFNYNAASGIISGICGTWTQGDIATVTVRNITRGGFIITGGTQTIALHKASASTNENNNGHARHGQLLDARPTPPYHVTNYTFRLDAEAFSRWHTGAEAGGLQFTTRGGSDAWSAGFVSPYPQGIHRQLYEWNGTPLSASRQLNPVRFIVTAGPGFTVDGASSGAAYDSVLSYIEGTMNGDWSGSGTQWFTGNALDASPSHISYGTIGVAHRRLTVSIPQIHERLSGWLHITLAGDESWYMTTIDDEPLTSDNEMWLGSGLHVSDNEAEIEVRLITGTGRETVLFPWRSFSGSQIDPGVPGGTRHGQLLDRRPAPPYHVTDYTFRLDAEAFSRWHTGYEAGGLQFTARGGNDAWNAGFISPYDRGIHRQLYEWGGTPLPEYRQLNPIEFIVTPGPGFMVNGVSSGWEYEYVLHMIQDSMNGAGGVAAQWFTGGALNASPNQILDGTIGVAHRRLTVSVPRIDYNLSGWLHISMGVPGGSWHLTTVDDEPLEYDFWGYNSDSDSNGVWIGCGLFVGTSEAEVEVRLIAGTGRETVLLPFSSTAADGADGVSISTERVISMNAVGALSSIRIEELRPNGAMTLPFVNNIRPDHNNYYVRLVAPRGFVWETGHIPGVSTQALRAEFNSDVFVGNAAARSVTPSVRHFENPTTGRDELILTIPHLARRTDIVASNARGAITLRGLTLIPTRSDSPRDVAIDVYFGNDAGTGTFQGQSVSTIGHMNSHMQEQGRIVPGTNENHLNVGTSFSAFWRENFWPETWRNRGLIVADYDPDAPPVTAIITSGPASLPTLSSGALSVRGGWEGWGADRVFVPQASGTNARWTNGAEHTIRIEEVLPGDILRTIDRFEIVPVNHGVKIVDAQVRVGYASDRPSDRTGNAGRGFPWTNVTDTSRFLASLSTFNDGNSFQFAPRSLDIAGTPAGQERLSGVSRSIDIRMLYSIQAGYEGKYGSDVKFEIFRNSVSIGVVTVATVTDPFVVEHEPTTVLTRHSIDDIPFTTVSSFTIAETAVGNLKFGDIFYISLHVTQDGKLINIPQDLLLMMGLPQINAASDMVVSPLGVASNATSTMGVAAYRVTRESHGVPARISFNNVRVMGPVRPGLDWHVVVSGETIALNNVMLADPVSHVEDHGIPLIDYERIGGVRTAVTSADQRRARFFDMPYCAKVLSVRGTSVIGAADVTVNSTGASHVMGNSTFDEGEIVNIFAGIRPGYIFTGWTVSPDVNLLDENNAFTSFIMPLQNTIITANWDAVDVKFGDVNGDGVIDEADLELLGRYLLASDKVAFIAANPQFICVNASFDGNGIITTTDYTRIRALIGA